MLTRRNVLIGAAAGALVASSARAEDWKAKYPELVFAVIPEENASGTIGRWTPFVDYLSKELGVKVTLRVAIARALVQEPELILADEPIASLDPRNTRVVMDALQRINRHHGLTVLCNLHSLELARFYCDRLIGMAHGRVVFDGAPERLTEAAAHELYGLEAKETAGTAPAEIPSGAAAAAA